MASPDALAVPEGLSADAIKQLTLHGASILCVDTPAGTEVGLDYGTWTVAAAFRGFKMIPPGLHFVFWAAKGSLGDLAPREGLLLRLAPEQVIVLKWNKDDETFERLDVDADVTASGLAASVRKLEFDSGLGPYPLKSLATWMELVKHVSETVLDKVAPIGGRVVSTPAALLEESKAEERKSGESQSRRMYFSRIPGVGSGSSGSDITSLAMDTTSSLLSVLKGYDNHDEDLIGEVELAFVLFLLGQSLEAFEQWKRLVDLMLRCEMGLGTTATSARLCRLATLLLQVLMVQLQEIPTDFFDSDLTHRNFLGGSLSRFLEIVDDNSEASASVAPTIAQLQLLCSKRFNWVITTAQANEEDGPTWVDLEATMF